MKLHKFKKASRNNMIEQLSYNIPVFDLSDNLCGSKMKDAGQPIITNQALSPGMPPESFA